MEEWKGKNWKDGRMKGKKLEGWRDGRMGKITGGGTPILRFFHSTFLSILLLLLILIPFSVVYAQNNTGKIAGQVIDKRKKPATRTAEGHPPDSPWRNRTKTRNSNRYEADSIYSIRLPIALDTYYTVSTTYEGQEYVEDDIVLSTWVPELKISI